MGKPKGTVARDCGTVERLVVLVPRAVPAGAGGRKGRPYSTKGTVVGDCGEVERLAVPTLRLFRQGRAGARPAPTARIA